MSPNPTISWCEEVRIQGRTLRWNKYVTISQPQAEFSSKQNPSACDLKEAPRRLDVPSVTTQAFKKPPSSNNRALLDTQCTAVSTSDSPDSETMRNVLVLFVRYLVYDIVAKQHSQTKTESMLKNFTVRLLVLYYSITAFTKQTQWLCSTPTHFLRFWGSGREAQLRV